MAITLTPELEAIVREDAQVLGFEDAEAYLAAQLTALHESELYLRENREEIAAMIEEGWQSAERGELYTPEEAAELRAETKRKYVARASAA